MKTETATTMAAITATMANSCSLRRVFPSGISLGSIRLTFYVVGAYSEAEISGA
jgi:hypothetical protein